jgi:PilZ domain
MADDSLMPDRRQSPRAPVRSRAWLTAVRCRQVARGARLEAVVSDISCDAAGLVVSGTLWQGDVFVLHGRSFEVEMDVEVVVASARRSPMDGLTTAGCSFRQLTGAQRVAIERIILGRAAQDDLGLGARFLLGA